ncbi:hypothetical protein [Brachybacterium tyrofermentans]|uniref:hypothetical protein n=1 Tax=Brachybacterium tyrofermentans TaxID=47848 RepID=UPI003FD60585
MSSPTADHSVPGSALSPGVRGTGSQTTGRQLRFVRSGDIDAYADEVASLLKSTIRLAVPVRDGGIELPVPEDLVQREVSAAANIDDSHAGAVADSALVDTVGTSWSIRKVRTELGGVSPQAVHQRVDRGTLWALPTSDGSSVFPTFQFVRRNGRLGTRRGLQAMFRVLRAEDPWAVAVLMNTPAPELDGLSPVDWERRGGGADALERLAHALVREWNRP